MFNFIILDTHSTQRRIRVILKTTLFFRSEEDCRVLQLQVYYTNGDWGTSINRIDKDTEPSFHTVTV